MGLIDEHVLALTIIGESVPTKQLLAIICRVADYDAPVLIKGETGTGKELVARGIHYNSKRRNAPFVSVNGAAFHDDLFLSELFGHEKGAFTDAKRDKKGLLEQAQNGTIFLDEVDSLSLKSQASLLRFLQEGEYRAVGSEKVKQANVRVLSATNKNLIELISTQHFREDLYYRLDVLGIDVPSLKDRGEDILLLSEYFLDQLRNRYQGEYKYLHFNTIDLFMQYEWPGNIRELENYLHRLYILSNRNEILINRIKENPAVSGDNEGYGTMPDGCCSDIGYEENSQSVNILTIESPGIFQHEKAKAIAFFEKEYLYNMLELCAGNITQVAQKSGKERRAIGKLLKKYGIDRQQFTKSA